MALKTSELWQDLLCRPNTRREYQFDINGVIYGAESEVSHSVDNGLFEELSIGNAACAKLTLTLIAESIPRGARIKRFERLVDGGQASEWLPAGVYFINRRSVEDDCWTIEAMDVMRKAEIVWEPRQDLEFPLAMPTAVDEFAAIMGCEIDPRTVLNPAYTIDYPANNMTIRQSLQYIAAAHGGNWIVTAEGKLLLIPLGSEPPETHYIIDEYGRALRLGGVRLYA